MNKIFFKRRKAQTATEFMLLLGGAILVLIIVFSYSRSQLLQEGLSNVATYGNESIQNIENITDRSLEYNLTTPTLVPTPCACGFNASCPSGEELVDICENGCDVSGCLSCNAVCSKEVTGCGTLSHEGYYLLSANVTEKNSCLKDVKDNTTIDCNGFWVVGEGKGTGIEAFNNDNVIVRNCFIINFANGVYFKNGQNNTVENSWFDDNAYAMRIEDEPRMNIHQNAILANTYGIFITQSEEINVSLNNVTNGFATTAGIYFEDDSSNASITFNSITGQGTYGIWGNDADDANVSYNNVSIFGTRAIYLQDIARGHFYFNNASKAITGYGMYLSDVDDSRFINNSLSSSGTCAIFNGLAGTCEATCKTNQGTCSNNTFANNTPFECTVSEIIG
ncbi:right-handed parallel beta-helix repeat-containing protein [Candidatus Micrarchaeota archaeon]|nr:right-handed parallel beta-helix repeat-containing protein [Candidatus Micrarchaeota archaeon]